MKKIFIIIILLVVSVLCFSQTYPVVNRANSSYTVQDARFSAQYNLFVPRYADTTAANLQLGNDSLSAIIFTYNTMTLWVRSQSPKVWIEVGSGGGGGSGTVTSIGITGTDFTITNSPVTISGNIGLTLATVNGNVGSLGSSTAIPSFTVNAKGLITAASTNVVIAPAGTLTGTTLNATVVTSSLTQVGIIGAGTWQGTSIGDTYISSAATWNAKQTGDATLTALAGLTITNGSIVYGTGADAFAVLPASTNGFVLTMVGGIPAWQVLPSDNLLFDSLGAAGISPMTTWNNTLYARRISISGGSIDTTASGGLLITISGGSGLFPTTGTGTATGAVIGALAGNTFNINQGANSFLSIDPTAGAETSFLRVINTTDDDHIGQFVVESTNTNVTTFFEAEFNGGIKRSGITGFADATTATIDYDADIHRFTGAMRLIALAGNGTGVVGVDNDGDLSFSASGGNTFVGLTDGPGVFTGQAGKSVRVNVGETALEYFTAAGSGDVIKVGTPVNNQLGIWTGDGTIEGSANLTFASSTLNIGVVGAATGILTVSGVTSGTITIQPASAAGTYTLTLPTTDGGANEFLQTNGSGVLTWAAGGGTPALTQYRLAVGDASNLLSTGAAITGNRALISDANGVPTHATTTATEIGYVNGVTSAIQTQLDNKVFALNVFCGTITAFTDDQEIFYFAQVGVPVTTATFYSLVIDRTCTLIAASITMRLSTVGTGEAWSMYVRVNDATDYLIETVSSIASRRTWNNNALNTTGISLSPGDEIVIKMVNPPWATNPATGVVNGYLTFR